MDTLQHNSNSPKSKSEQKEEEEYNVNKSINHRNANRQMQGLISYLVSFLVAHAAVSRVVFQGCLYITHQTSHIRVHT
jgi:hypothetical protein